jgi:hypothetical protein
LLVLVALMSFTFLRLLLLKKENEK